jgi:hypothetical protein
VDTFVPDPPPNPGDPCTVLNEKKTKSCGKCGKAETLCEATAPDAGTLKWSTYGPCTNEVGICEPNTTRACGNCGTETCNTTCNWGGACAGQPMNSCPAGNIEYTQAGCTGMTYKNRTCGSNCQWGIFTTVCAAPNNPNKLNVSNTASGTVTGNYTLSNTKMGRRVTGTCGGSFTSVSTSVDHPYEIVQLNNTHATLTAKVSAWLTGPVEIDTVMAAYPTILPPSTDAELKACSEGVNDYCPSSLPCTSQDGFSGLTGTDQISIPPGQAVLVRFSSYYTNASGSVTTGAVTLTVRTDAMQ